LLAPVSNEKNSRNNRDTREQLKKKRSHHFQNEKRHSFTPENQGTGITRKINKPGASFGLLNPSTIIKDFKSVSLCMWFFPREARDGELFPGALRGAGSHR
jgi:hypothetical protein